MNNTSLPFDFRDIELSEDEYTLFAKLIYERSGISLGENKKDLVKARLRKRLKFYKLDSYREYYEYLLSDKCGVEIVELIDAISTNVTSFFRENQHFDFLSKKILPEIIEKKRQEKCNTIRVWSSASSTGEEIYSIIITLCEHLGNILPWDIKVLGTDISTKALAAAKLGSYNEEKIKTVSPQLREKYFIKKNDTDGVIYEVKPEFKQLAVFHRINLMDEAFPFKKKFDIIFCRNVMIYFDRRTQEELINKFTRYLPQDGFLLIGHSETLLGMKTDFRSIASAVYQKI